MLFKPENDVRRCYICGTQGRGTVITGRIEQGIVRIGDEIELVGINQKPTKSVVTGEN